MEEGQNQGSECVICTEQMKESFFFRISRMKLQVPCVCSDSVDFALKVFRARKLQFPSTFLRYLVIFIFCVHQKNSFQFCPTITVRWVMFARGIRTGSSLIGTFVYL